jgi:hypothetical protein
MRIDSNKFHPVGLEAGIFVMKSLHAEVSRRIAVPVSGWHCV